jgi:hypothetical protein
LSKIIAQKIKIEDEVVESIIQRRRLVNKKNEAELNFNKIQ